MVSRRPVDESEFPIAEDYGLQPLRVEQFFQLPDVGLHVQRVPNHPTVLAHTHDFREIVYVASGHALHEIEQRDAQGRTLRAQRQRLVPGDCFALARGGWHAFAKVRRLTLYNVLFTDQALIGQAGLIGELPAARQLLDGLDAGGEIFALHLGLDERERVVGCMDAILAEAQRRRPGYASAMRAQLLLLLVELSRAWSRARGEDTGTRTHPRQREAVEAARAFIEEHLADPLTLDRIAAEAGLSSSHLSTLFKRRFAVSPFDYLAKLRLERAKHLLRTTTLGVGDVARAVGFADPSYFARCFHAAVGETPRRFRQLARG